MLIKTPNSSQELIKVKGLQVAPAELEAQLLEHPGIADAAVVGVTMFVFTFLVSAEFTNRSVKPQRRR